MAHPTQPTSSESHKANEGSASSGGRFIPEHDATPSTETIPIVTPKHPLIINITSPSEPERNKLSSVIAEKTSGISQTSDRNATQLVTHTNYTLEQVVEAAGKETISQVQRTYPRDAANAKIGAGRFKPPNMPILRNPL